jgi:hypothetical protein
MGEEQTELADLRSTRMEHRVVQKSFIPMLKRFDG